MIEIFFRALDSESLLYVLCDDFPYTFVESHQPYPAARWWRTQVPLNVLGEQMDLEIRGLRYDFQTETATLKKCQPYLGTGEIALFQSIRKISDTFAPRNIDHIPQNRQREIWIQNGIRLHVWIPHSGEVSRVWTVDHSVAEQILQHPKLADLVL